MAEPKMFGKYMYETEPGIAAANGKPSKGPVYRFVAAQQGFTELPSNLHSLYEVFQQSVTQYPDNDCLGRRVDGKGEFVFESYRAVAEKVAHVASAMAHVGLEAHGRAGIYSVNCPEWMTTMQACNRMTIYTVPLYDTLGEEAVEYVIQHSECRIVFVSTVNWAELGKTLPALKEQVHTLVYWGPQAVPVDTKAATSLGYKVYSWQEFLEVGKAHPAAAVPPRADDICTIMYTSGTTGTPKGVIITHSIVKACIAATKSHLKHLDDVDDMSESDTFLSFLPLAHIMDRAAEESILHSGGKIGYYSGDVKLLVNDIAALRPTIFIAVPRVFDRIYAGVMEQLKGSALRKWIFDLGYRRKLRFLNMGYPPSKASPFFDWLLFSKIKARLGGRVRIALSGAAPLAPHVEDFLRVGLCCHFFQGYGLTETCAASFLSSGEADQVGTVGVPTPSHEYRLESIPEMNYDAQGTPARGEVCMKGLIIFKGYYKEPKMTEEVLDKDGWFHTGDVGEITPSGALKVIDRKKQLFKLSQGEYVSPEKVESAYKKLSLIAQLYVYGNSLEGSLVAVVVPEEGPFVAAAKQAGLNGSFKELVKDPKAEQMMLSKMNAVAKETGLKGFEMVRAIILEEELFAVENNLLTPTFKLKRPKLKEKYLPAFDKLYTNMKSKGK